MLQRPKMLRVVTVALAGAVVVAGCGGEQPETVAPARATTIPTAPLVPSEALAVGPSSANFSEEQVFDLLLNGLEPPAGASFEGRFRSPDAGNLDYGYPPEPCTFSDSKSMSSVPTAPTAKVSEWTTELLKAVSA